MTEIKPITPNEVSKMSKARIPDFVIKVVNQLIVENWNGRESKILCDEVIDRIRSEVSIDRDDIYKNHYLDFEDLYRDLGWNVKYDQPAYYENYKAFYIFKK